MTDERLQKEIDRLVEGLKNNYLFYLSRYFDKVMISPDMIQIMLTSKCNIRCKICEVWKQKFDGELTTDEVKSLLDQAIDMGARTVYFTGGEALLRPDILGLIDYASRPGIITTVNTNGSLITKELAKKIVLSKLKNITFSIDSVTPAGHDSIRGKGVFKKAIRGIKLINHYKRKFHRGKDNPAEEQRLDVGMVSVIMKNNIDEIARLVNLAKNAGCCYIAFQPLIYNGSLLENVDFKSGFSIEEGDIHKLEDAFQKLGSVKQQMLSRGFHVDFMQEKTVQHFRKERKVNTCFAGFSRIFINPQGDISFVCFESFGNIKSDRLSDVWYGQKAYAIRKRIKECGVNCTQFCSERPESESLEIIHKNFQNDISSRFHNYICTGLLKQEYAFLDSLLREAESDPYVKQEVLKIKQDIGEKIGLSPK